MSPHFLEMGGNEPVTSPAPQLNTALHLKLEDY